MLLGRTDTGAVILLGALVQHTENYIITFLPVLSLPRLLLACRKMVAQDGYFHMPLPGLGPRPRTKYFWIKIMEFCCYRTNSQILCYLHKNTYPASRSKGSLPHLCLLDAVEEEP